MRTSPRPTSGRPHIPGPQGKIGGIAEVRTDRRGRPAGYKTRETRKECHKAASPERGTKPWTTIATWSHSGTARWATKIKSQPPEKTNPPSYAPTERACPTQTQWEDPIRLRQPCPPANTTPDA